MDNVTVVKEVLELSGCQNAKSISAMAMRKFHYEISTGSVLGVLRVLQGKGVVASSEDGHGQKIYWLTRQNFRKEN